METSGGSGADQVRTPSADRQPTPPATLSSSSTTGKGGGVAGPAAAPASKGKRRTWLTDQDVLALKAILTSSAHVAPRGQRLKRFEAAATTFNDHPQAAFKTSGKNLLDHFNKISSQFSAEDKAKARQTGQEEELSERDKILSDMIEAAEVLQAEEDAAKGEAAETKKKLDAEGLAVRELAMQRRHRQPKENAPDDEEEIEEQQPSSASRRGKKRRTREIDDIEGGDLLALLDRSERRLEQRADKQMEQIDKRFEEQRKAREAADRDREERQDRKDEMFLSVLGELARKLPGNRGPTE